MEKIKIDNRGFTLVELMIAVAIIGVLAAVTVPNFKKFQAKTKTVEAKIQLASVYTAQTSFYQLFDMYETCLDYMGYSPGEVQGARHYAVGFPNITANIDATFHASAVGERLVVTECPRDLGEVQGVSIYLAGKSIGSNVIDNLASFRAAATLTSNALDEGAGPKSDEVHAGIGLQTLLDTKVFSAAAIGYIDAGHITPTRASIWSINQDKKITNFRTGY